MSFFGVFHEFKSKETAEAFWKTMSEMKDEDYKTMGEKNAKNGVWNHCFMPTGGDGPTYCVWETKEDTSVENFQKFIDGPDGPSEGTWNNKVYKSLPGGSVPPSFFKQGAGSPAGATKGSFFWVHHEFKKDQAAEFFKWVGTLKDQDWADIDKKNRSLGFKNHTFQPMGQEGPCFCIWEAEKEMDVAEFQKFIDGPDGPGAGKTFNNTVYKSGAGTNPNAAFPKK